MSEWVNADGTLGDIASAPDEVRSLAENKGFTSVNDIAKAYTNLESMKGEWSNPDAIKIPETLSPEHVAMIQGKLGVPQSVDDYKYDFAEGSQIDDGLYDNFRNFAAENKLSTDQFKGALDFYESMTSTGKEAYEAEVQGLVAKGEEALKGKWKESYDTNIEKANGFADKSGLKDIFDNYGITNFPDVREKLYELSAMLDEGQLPNAEVTIQKTKDEQIKELTSNPAYTDAMNLEHDNVIAKLNKLLGITA